jgi:hypothetical protein
VWLVLTAAPFVANCRPWRRELPHAVSVREGRSVGGERGGESVKIVPTERQSTIGTERRRISKNSCAFVVNFSFCSNCTVRQKKKVNIESVQEALKG